jgi:hypothetical protein
MNVSVDHTFLGIIKFLTLCVNVLLLITAGNLILKDLRRVVDNDPHPDPSSGKFNRFMKRHGYVLLCGVAFFANRFFERYMTQSNDRYLKTGGGLLITMIFSLLLFILKLTLPLIYGFFELGFAVVSCRFSLGLLGDTFTMAPLIAFISSIYLMIRAFDNIKRGFDERKKKIAVLNQV